jgi:hypothetical protein
MNHNQCQRQNEPSGEETPAWHGVIAGRAFRRGWIAAVLMLALGASLVQAQTAPTIAPGASSPQQSGSEFWVEVRVGTTDRPVSNLFGASFVLDYDPSRVSVVDEEAGPFLGNDVVFSSNDNASAGEMGIGVSRKSGAGGTDGHGVVARVKFTVATGTSSGRAVSFAVKEVSANDSNGDSIPLVPEALDVAIGDMAPAFTPVLAGPPQPGTEFWVDIRAGSSLVPTSGLFGASFVLEYDPARVSVVDEEAGPFLGSDVVFSTNDDATSGEIGIGISRKAGSGGVDGTGIVARVKFALDGGASEDRALPFVLKDVNATDATGASLTFRTIDVPQRSAVSAGQTGLIYEGRGLRVRFSEGSSAAGSLEVSRFEGAPATSSISGTATSDDGSQVTPDVVSRDLFYRVEPVGLSDVEAEVCLPVRPIGGVEAPGQLVLLTRTETGDTWRPLDSALKGGAVCAAGLTSFSQFSVGSERSSNPLPVELVEFDAHMSNGDVQLHWQTATETNNAGFAVQHQTPDASSFREVGFVEGAGTTQEPQAYRFRADGLAPGTHRFRLRQVDVDGSATLTDPVTVTIEAERVLSLQATGPNPVRQFTQFAFTVQQSGPAEVTLYNVLGQRVRTLYAEEATVGQRHAVTVDTVDLPSGTYFVRLAAPSGTRTQRIVVVR